MGYYDEPDLGPCPFCGGKAKQERAWARGVEWEYRVECECGIGTSWTDKEISAKAWNRRITHE